jgi:hypothetical protein
MGERILRPDQEGSPLLRFSRAVGIMEVVQVQTALQGSKILRGQKAFLAATFQVSPGFHNAVTGSADIAEVVQERRPADLQLYAEAMPAAILLFLNAH